MRIEHSGWTVEQGSFKYFVTVDDTKTDYKIHYQNGSIARQSTPFHSVKADWNNDGDVYVQYGANFNYFDKNGEPDGRCFLTPKEMVESLIRTLEGEDIGGYTVIAIPGIEVPTPEKRPLLKEHIARSEKQQMAQDIEKNRKMNTLGIREPGDPWAR